MTFLSPFKHPSLLCVDSLLINVARAGPRCVQSNCRRTNSAAGGHDLDFVLDELFRVMSGQEHDGCCYHRTYGGVQGGGRQSCKL